MCELYISDSEETDFNERDVLCVICFIFGSSTKLKSLSSIFESFIESISKALTEKSLDKRMANAAPTYPSPTTAISKFLIGMDFGTNFSLFNVLEFYLTLLQSYTPKASSSNQDY